MAALIEVDNLRNGYVDIVRTVREHGEPLAPRGLKTLDLPSVTIVLNDPTDALPIGVGRKLNVAIGAAEALQLVGGVSDPALMGRITPNFNRFKNGGSFDGAYGPRIRHQVPEAVRRIQNDPDTRQAVIAIWDAAYDLFRTDSLDYPCTLHLRLSVRHRRLEMQSVMRSQDVWWGLAYDLYQFAQLQLAVANVLGMPPGPLTHHTHSLHLYERDWSKVDELHWSDVAPLKQSGLTGATVREVQLVARSLLAGTATVQTPQELWLDNAVKSYRA